MVKPIIFVCSHAPFKIFQNKVIRGILVGASNMPKTEEIPFNQNSLLDAKKQSVISTEYMFKDNEGINISLKNREYCELTGMYWAFKNLDKSFDYVGIFHYRRYLSFKKNIFLSRFFSVFPKINAWLFGWNEDFINKKLEAYDFILPKKDSLFFLSKGQEQNPSLHKNMVHNYGIYVVEKLYESILTNFPHYKEALAITKEQQSIYFKNMFIMKRIYFNEYMEFLFKTLFYLEENFNKENSNNVNTHRLYGFLAERMINIFITYKTLTQGEDLKLLELKVVKKFDFKFSANYFKVQYNKLRRRLNFKYVISLWHHFKLKNDK